MKDSFQCLIETQQQILRLSKNEEEIKEAQSFMNNLINDMLNTEWNKRGKFAILSEIVKAVGSKHVIQVSPLFMDELFCVFE